MNAYAGVLLEDYGSQLDEIARGYLEKIRRSSDRMNRLTQDVLAYSRVARSQAQPDVIEFDRLVRDVVHQHTDLQPSAVQIEIVGPLPAVLGHETTLGQSVSNLLSNAVKFVAPGVKPRVRIRAERAGKYVRVWFVDNGIGIKPEHQQRIFGMFERAHPDGMYEGNGIGLTIVRKVLEKMGGKVGVESDGKNGSRFGSSCAAPRNSSERAADFFGQDRDTTRIARAGSCPQCSVYSRRAAFAVANRRLSLTNLLKFCRKRPIERMERRIASLSAWTRTEMDN